MIEYFQKSLFEDIFIDEYKRLFSCLDGRTEQFKAGETICDYDEGFREIGTIDKGTASAIRYECNGARTILERLGPQDTFGHLLSYEGSEYAGAGVVCGGPYDVFFTYYATIGSPCAKSCVHHHQLTQNLLDLITERILNLSRRVEVLSQRAIHEKLIRHSVQLTAQAKASPFSLPFTMADLADYLPIDRSAMTRELERMKEEGLTEVNRRCVRLFF